MVSFCRGFRGNETVDYFKLEFKMGGEYPVLRFRCGLMLGRETLAEVFDSHLEARKVFFEELFHLKGRWSAIVRIKGF